MCGIAGILSLAGPPDAGRVRAMGDSLAHRGPDGAGFFADGPLAMAHRRLAVIDLTPAGAQPMADSSGRYVIAFNGEIYNHVELRGALESIGARFRSRSDTEVLLEGYALLGPGILPRLNGMFAFAVWDRRDRTLFAARDRFGEKPLYYAEDGTGEFRFASEIRALAVAAPAPLRPRPAALYAFLTYGHAGSSRETFFEGIRQVPPAHGLLWRDGRITLRRYWALPDRPARPPGGAREHAEETGRLFEDSVRLRLRSDVPVGTSLSGGIDSTAVACAVARLRGNGPAGPAGRPAAFSACFPGHAVDEGRWMAEVSEYAGLDAHRVEPRGEDLLHDLPRVLLTQEEPTGGPGIYSQWRVMGEAQRRGVVVLLDGQGADEVFAGYHTFFDDLWWSWLRGLRLGGVLDGTRGYDLVHGAGSARRRLFAAGRGRAVTAIRRVTGPPAPPWLDAEFARAAAVPLPSPPRGLRQSLRDAQRERMLPHLLRYADRNSMAFSREVRLPFLDHRLVEYVDALPDEEKLSGGLTKRVLRRALRGSVPEAVRRRTDKVGFAAPTADWLRGPLAETLGDTLLASSLRQRGILDPAFLARARDRLVAGEDGSAQILWNAFECEQWLRTVVDGRFGAGAG